jgi:hypothetical protein
VPSEGNVRIVSGAPAKLDFLNLLPTDIPTETTFAAWVAGVCLLLAFSANPRGADSD